MSWNDFNSADDQSFDLIPKGTLVKVHMTVRPGGIDDPNQGWTGGYATKSDTSDAVYLDCEFVILAGEYVRRKVWGRIGLYSPKGPEWANIGRSFVKGILNSARGINPKDMSDAAQQARRINGFADLDGIEFVARIDLEKDQHGDYRNVIKSAVPPDHAQYAAIMGATAAQPAPTQQAAPASPAGAAERPSWAQ